MEINKIKNIDCLEYCKKIKDNTINLCILDPPKSIVYQNISNGLINLF